MPKIKDNKKIFKKEKEEPAKIYSPTGEELEIKEYLSTRIEELKDYRKQKLKGAGRSIEEIWKEADEEYTPHELGVQSDRKRFESNDELGLRSRLVKIGSENWQSNNASPDLYVKVNTALSILVGQNPEAVFIARASKYESNTLLAYNNWKNSWELSGAKQQLKHFIFNQAKYGTGVGRTYPKLIEQNKRVRVEYYPNEPDRDKYVEKRIVKYNGLCRESINPNQVWLSEQAMVGDIFSIDDWYFEKDFSWDKFKETFRDYKNLDFVVKKELTKDENGRTKNVTVGFYENQLKDLYVVWIPETKVVLYSSPLLNDDGKLSLWFAPWTLRDDRTPWGIGLYEIIKQDSVLYDKLANMTMDQLVLSIYKMFFYKGTDLLGENGNLVVEPGKGIQVVEPQTVNFLNIPGPGQESWKGLEYLQQKRDLNSGVTPQLYSQFTGKTLGQDIQAKEAALERMRTPLDYLLDALQVEAYLSLSWLKQILSVPEVLEYTDENDLIESLKEAGLQEEEIKAYLEENKNHTGNGLLNQEETGEVEQVQTGLNPETGEPIMEEQPQIKTVANIYPEQRYGLESDENGELIESDETKFYRFGVHLGIDRLNWEGMIRITPQSVLAPSKELTKRMKLDLFNLVMPAINQMVAQPQFIPILLPSIKQIIKVYEENVKDWFDEKFLTDLYKQSQEPKPAPEKEESVSLSVKFESLPPEVQPKIIEKYFGIKIEPPLFVKAGQQGSPQGVNIPKMGGVLADGESPEEFEPLVPRGNIRPGQTEEGAIAAAMKVE
jgi:DNA-binding transcriptional MerR regulator